MTLIRRRIAERLVRAQHEAALLTTVNEVDMTEVIALRKKYNEVFQKKYGIKLGFMSFLLRRRSKPSRSSRRSMPRFATRTSSIATITTLAWRLAAAKAW